MLGLSSLGEHALGEMADANPSITYKPVSRLESGVSFFKPGEVPVLGLDLLWDSGDSMIWDDENDLGWEV